MTYFKPEIIPGMRKDGSQHEAMNTWFDGNNVRFKLGKPQSIGGWSERTLKGFADSQRDLNGVSRSIFQWVSGGGNSYTLVGTTWKVYLIHNGNVYDVTPLRDDNLGPVSPKADDYSFPVPGPTPAVDVTTMGIRSTYLAKPIPSGSHVRIKTIEGGNTVVSTNNTFVMMKDIAFNAITGEADLDGSIFDSGYSPGSTQDDGWQLFQQNGEQYIKINENATSFTSYNSTLNTDINDSTTTLKLDAPTAGPEEGDIVALVLSSGFGSNVKELIRLGARTGASTPFTYTGCERNVYPTSSTPTPLEWLTGQTVRIYEKELTLTGASGKVWYSIDPGVDSDVSAVDAAGWGLGSWDETGSSWGTPSVLPALANTSLRYWSFFSNGDDIVASPTNGEIYYLDLSDIADAAGIPKISTVNERRFIKLSQQGDDKGVIPVKIPKINGDILLTTLSGHLISFSTEHFSGGSTTEFSPILVRWSDNDLNDKYIFDWGLRSTNTSGGLLLNSGSSIEGMAETNREILIWTDVSMYSMRYTGPPSVFSLKLISLNVNLISRNSQIAVGDEVFFMGSDSFYRYKGQISKILCTVSNHVFDNINSSQLSKVYACQDFRFSEVTWFYPSANSFEVNMYVTYNYLEQVWTTGSLDMNEITTTGSETSEGRNRTAWLGTSMERKPMSSFVKTFNLSSLPEVATSSLLDQEVGYSRSFLGASPLSLESYIESGDISFDDGNEVLFMRKFFPDIHWTGAAPISEDQGVSIEFSAKKYPDSFEPTSVSSTKVFNPTEDSSTVSVTNPVPQDGKYDVRARGRTFSVKLTSDTTNYGWRIGDMAIDIRPDGKRS